MKQCKVIVGSPEECEAIANEFSVKKDVFATQWVADPFKPLSLYLIIWYNESK